MREWRRIAASSSSPGVIPVRVSSDEEDEVGLGDRAARLLGDLLRQRRRVGDVDAAGVDEQEALAGPLADDLLAVARDAGRLVDDGLARAGQPVDERRLADVREADDGDRAEQLVGAHGGAWRRRPAVLVQAPEPAPEPVDLLLDQRRALSVALARAGDALEPHRLAPGDRDRMEVARAARTGCRRSPPARPERPPGARPSPRRASLRPAYRFFCRVPSTKRPSALPSRTISRIARTASRSDSPRRTERAPNARISWPSPKWLWISLFARKWIVRGQAVPKAGGSSHEKWFMASTTPPSSGMRSAP